ncbi:MAG: hypothetical protein AAFU85_30780 [Planctomycetota bacterium]
MRLPNLGVATVLEPASDEAIDDEKYAPRHVQTACPSSFLDDAFVVDRRSAMRHTHRDSERAKALAKVKAFIGKSWY